jgi:hypothetical protein
MTKKIYLFLLIVLVSSLGSKAQMFEFSARDAAKLPKRKLIVILQSEESDILNRIKKDPEKIQRYKSLITYSNNLLKKTVINFWKAGQPIEFRTFEDCKKIAETDSAQFYMTLDFTSLRVNENVQLYHLKPDTLNIYGLRRELMRRSEYGYFELKLLEKFRAAAFYTFHIPASIPNEYDFIAAIQFMSALVKEKLNDPKFSTRDYELKIQQANGILARRTLMVDSVVVNKQFKSYAYIKKEYDSLCLYQLSNPQEIAAKAYTKDTAFAYLCIVPYLDPIGRGQSYMGTTGGNLNDYEKRVYFMQLIFDIGTGELLYYDKSEENVVIVRDWRRFLRYSREKPFTLPNFKSPNPYQQQQNQYPQNQY